MKALSIRQPWAWLVANGYKDIENRSWATGFRGPVLIHASAGMTRQEYDDVVEFIDGDMLGVKLPLRDALERGGIIGVATITACVAHSDSPWFFGPKGFVLNDCRPMAFIPFKGALGFFDVPDELIARSSTE